MTNEEFIKMLYQEQKAGRPLPDEALEIMSRKRGIDIPADLYSSYVSTVPSFEDFMDNQNINPKSPLGTLLGMKWEDDKPYMMGHKDELPSHVPKYKGDLEGVAYTKGSYGAAPDTIHYIKNLGNLVKPVFNTLNYDKANPPLDFINRKFDEEINK